MIDPKELDAIRDARMLRECSGQVCSCYVSVALVACKDLGDYSGSFEPDSELFARSDMVRTWIERPKRLQHCRCREVECALSTNAVFGNEFHQLRSPVDRLPVNS